MIDRLKLVLGNTVEVVTLDELKKVLEKDKPRAYIGYEPSGLVHIGWLIWMNKVRDLAEAGVEVTVLEATWHAYINDKLGRDMELIRASARLVRKIMEYMGIPMGRIRLVDVEDIVSDKECWSIFVRVAKNTTLARVKRALTIMGRRASEAETDFSKLVYPLMQVTDMIYLGVDIALGGTDQRRAHMLQRDVAEKLGVKKVVAIHTPLLVGLKGLGKRMDVVDKEDLLMDIKMSKSKPETAIFIHDKPEDIMWKIRKAYCPPKQVEYNPVIEINKYILFRQPGFKLYIERPEKYGGPIVIEEYRVLEEIYANGELHPLDLKNATAKALIEYLEPIRKQLESDKEAMDTIKLLSTRITR